MISPLCVNFSPFFILIIYFKVFLFSFYFFSYLFYIFTLVFIIVNVLLHSTLLIDALPKKKKERCKATSRCSCVHIGCNAIIYIYCDAHKAHRYCVRNIVQDVKMSCDFGNCYIFYFLTIV